MTLGLLQSGELFGTAVMIITVCVLGVLGTPIETYNEAIVARIPGDVFGRGFQFAGLIVTDDSTGTIVPHEYGHLLQQREYGTIGYMIRVAVPSLISAAVMSPERHAGMPWEVEASELGDYISPEERMAMEVERILEELEGRNEK